MWGRGEGPPSSGRHMCEDREGGGLVCGRGDEYGHQKAPDRSVLRDKSFIKTLILDSVTNTHFKGKVQYFSDTF